MTDLPPSQWPVNYLPSMSEWQSAFANAQANSASIAHTYTDTSIAPLQAQIAANTTTNTSNASAISALQAATARNPATADQDFAGHRVFNLAAGASALDAVRFDQLSMRRISKADILLTGVGTVAFTLLPGFRRYRMSWAILTTSAIGFLFGRFALASTGNDNRTVYNSCAQEMRSNSTVVYTGVQAATQIAFCATNGPSQNHNGFFEFDPAGFGFFMNTCSDANGNYFTWGSGIYVAGFPQAVILGHAGLINGGSVWLDGIP